MSSGSPQQGTELQGLSTYNPNDTISANANDDHNININTPNEYAGSSNVIPNNNHNNTMDPAYQSQSAPSMPNDTISDINIQSNPQNDDNIDLSNPYTSHQSSLVTSNSSKKLDQPPSYYETTTTGLDGVGLQQDSLILSIIQQQNNSNQLSPTPFFEAAAPQQAQPPTQYNGTPPWYPYPPSSSSNHQKHKAIEGVLDFMGTPTVHMLTDIPREWLSQDKDEYDIHDFRRDQSNLGLGFWECFGAWLGVIGLGLGAMGAIGVIVETPGLYLPGLIIGPLALFIYYNLFVMCTWLCCCGACDRKCDQCCFKTPYFSAIYNRKEDHADGVANGDASGATEVKKCITRLQKDVPIIACRVVCSHSKKQGKKTVRVVTYSATHCMPMAHLKYDGVDGDEFLRQIDRFTNGDVSIRYEPELIFHPHQQDYLAKWFHYCYQMNKHRDADCTVRLKILSSSAGSPVNENPSGYSYTIPYNARSPSSYMHLDPKFSNVCYDNDHDREGIYNRVNQKPKWTSVTPSIAATSLDRHTSIYRADNADAGCCLRCLTHPCSWAFGMIFCMAPCCLAFWHCRFKTVSYKSRFRVIFPRWDRIFAHETTGATPPTLLPSAD